MVYGLLTSGGLSEYYKLRKQTSDFAAAKPVTYSTDTYKYLDDPEFRKKYSRSNEALDTENCLTMDFYLEGVHCAACLWLIEKLPRIAPDIECATLNIGRSIARVTIKPNQSFAKAAKTLEKLGYKPHPVERDEQAELLQKKENRKALVRIGIAGASAGNIMLMAVPLYSGATGQFSLYFRWLSLALFAPILVYCAVPFYKNAWGSVQSKSMSIDLPVVLALLFGSSASIVHLFNGSEHLYFDSLAALVFLLLASRYVLHRIQQNAFHTSSLFQFLSPSVAKKISLASGEFEEVAAATLKSGDTIEVRPAEVIPADGVVLDGSSTVNCAILTGESTPILVSKGSEVYSGTVNEGCRLEIEVKSAGSQTRLGKILGQVEAGFSKKPQIVNAADKTAKWFLAVVFATALAVVFLAPSVSEGVTRALALVIVTCPCALALATPLTMSVSLGRAARAGLLIKNADILEKLSQAKHIVLDKTGTLTLGHFEVLQWNDYSPLMRVKDIVYALELKSTHPIAKALVSYLKSQVSHPLPTIEHFTEQLGQGVEGIVDGTKFSLRPLREARATAVGIYMDDVLVGDVHFGDKARPESELCIEKLTKAGLTSYIVSGDNRNAVEATARQVGIPTARIVACASPEQKLEFVQAHKGSLMVGDGANDAVALSSAFVGIAVHGSMEVSLRAADVYLTTPGLHPVVELVRIGRETMHVIYRNFAFSLLYNLAGGVAALTGHVTPLFAALLMPVSAVTVFASSLVGTKMLRSLGKARLKK